MRSHIIALILAITLVITVNAAAYNKREISASAQTCINSIKSVGEQLATTKPDIKAFSSADGYSGAYSIHTKEQTIEARLKQASKDCCSLSHLTTEEVTGVLGVVTKLVPQVVDVLAAIVSKKLDFKEISLATTVVKQDIKTISVLTNSLTTCLISKGSIADKIIGVALAAELDAAFATVAAL